MHGSCPACHGIGLVGLHLAHHVEIQATLQLRGLFSGLFLAVLPHGSHAKSSEQSDIRCWVKLGDGQQV